MTKWFNVVQLGDPVVQSYLDAILYLCDPTEKRVAHITVGGPYKTFDRASQRAGLYEQANILVVGISNFFEFGQNTVFLKCDSPLFKKLWDKKDYDYFPHITLYNGTSGEFARKLYSELKANRIFFSVPTGRVETIKSISGQNGFELILDLDVNKINSVAIENFDVEAIGKLQDWKRIAVVSRLLQKLIVSAQSKVLSGVYWPSAETQNSIRKIN